MKNKKFKKRKRNNPVDDWDNNEIGILLNYLKKNEFKLTEVQALFPFRSDTSIRNKVRRLKIKYDLFGESYRNEKKAFTQKWVEIIKPKIVFDAYAGAGHQSVIWLNTASQLIAVDKLKIKPDQFRQNLSNINFSLINHKGNWYQFSNNKDKEVFFFNGDVLRAAIEVSNIGFEIDILDLDTCGSTLPILPTLIAILRPKYIAITHGEFHSLRFRRDDVLRRVLFARDIRESTDNITVDDLIDELDRSVKLSALRSHNETRNSFWAELLDEVWLGEKPQGMLRRIYKLSRPSSTAECLNSLIK